MTVVYYIGRPKPIRYMSEEFLAFVESKLNEHGSYLVLHAVNEFYNNETNKPSYEKVASYIQGKGKYRVVRAMTSGNLTIERNPDYKEPKWTERNPFMYDIIKGLITFIFSVLAGWLLLVVKTQEQDRENKQLKTQVEALQKKVDSLSK